MEKAVFKKLEDLENEANQLGFRWEHPAQIISQIKSECDEVLVHLQEGASADKMALQEEIGDLLHAAFSLALFCQFSPEETLGKALDKFEKRLNAVKHIAHQRGLDSLEGLSFDELMTIWQMAKEGV